MQKWQGCFTAERMQPCPYELQLTNSRLQACSGGQATLESHGELHCCWHKGSPLKIPEQSVDIALALPEMPVYPLDRRYLHKQPRLMTACTQFHQQCPVWLRKHLWKILTRIGCSTQRSAIAFVLTPRCTPDASHTKMCVAPETILMQTGCQQRA